MPDPPRPPRLPRLPRLPRSLRALLALDRAALDLASAAHVVRDELASALVSPRAREALTLSLYAAQPTYAPGGVTYEAGLFAWERAALSAPPFAPGSTLLLGGAGGGREIVGLAALGFSVLAFEPCAPLAAQAASVAAAVSAGPVGAAGVASPPLTARAVQASYDDLVAYAACGGGPLAELLSGARPAATVLGWASLSHVLSLDRQRDILRAVAAVTVGGPVLVSFLLAGGEPPRAARFRRQLKAALGRQAEGAILFSPDAGFLRLSTPDEVTSIAAAAGYQVRHLALEPYPHAVLVAG